MFDLGLERAGMKCIGQVENDPWRQRALEQHWPDVKRWSDIREFTGDEIDTVELICGGYPCQGESGSGKRAGLEDDRWLWPEMLRIIKRKNPLWVICENVINHEGMGFSVVKTDLETAGYEVWTFIIPSAACRLQTVERHIWIIATSNEIRLQGNVKKPFQWLPEVPEEFQRDDQELFRRWALPESRVCRVGERCPDWVDRIKAIGDSIPPQIVEVLGKHIMHINDNILQI